MVKRNSFKPYYQDQLMVIPSILDELVSRLNPVRIVNDVINRINIQRLLDAYKIKCSSSYYTKMLLNMLVYGYISNVCSSRKLGVACLENINFMWLSGMSFPAHNAIKRFRGIRLKDVLRNIFEEVVKLLADAGLLKTVVI
ncbi:transposase [Sphingobacterium zeae]